jgi:hypothetical protein
VNADAFEAGHPVLRIAQHLDRRREQLKADALLLRVVHLLGAGRHLLARAPVDDHR